MLSCNTLRQNPRTAGTNRFSALRQDLAGQAVEGQWRASLDLLGMCLHHMECDKRGARKLLKSSLALVLSFLISAT